MQQFPSFQSASCFVCVCASASACVCVCVCVCVCMCTCACAAKGREELLQGDSEVLVEKDLTRLKGVGLAPSRELPAFWSGPAPATVALT